MVKSKDDIMNAIRERFSEDTTDEVIALIEDVNDTLEDLENKTKDNTDWKTKYEDNDKAWRQKYKDRFFTPTEKEDENEPGADREDPEEVPVTFDDLFTKN